MTDTQRSQLWLAGCVFAGGVVAAIACVLTAGVEDPTAWTSGRVWEFAGFCSGPLFLTAIGIGIGTRNDRVVWGTRLAAMPVLLVGIGFIYDCGSVINLAATGGLKGTWQSAFGVHWGTTIGLLAWPCAFITAAIGNDPRLAREMLFGRARRGGDS